MNAEIGELLKQIEIDSSEVQGVFVRTREHCSIGDFSSAIDAWTKLDGILQKERDLPYYEADTVGSFYAALAFRLVDTSTHKDKEKYEKVKEILSRAAAITYGWCDDMEKAKRLNETKARSMELDLCDRIAPYGKYLWSGLQRLRTNRLITLFYDHGYAVQLFHSLSGRGAQSTGKRLRKAVKSIISFPVEVVRGASIWVSSTIGLCYLASDNPGYGVMLLTVSAVLLLSRYVTRNEAGRNLGIRPEFKPTVVYENPTTHTQ